MCFYLCFRLWNEFSSSHVTPFFPSLIHVTFHHTLILFLCKWSILQEIKYNKTKGRLRSQAPFLCSPGSASHSKHALCPFIKLWHTKRYLKTELFHGNQHRKATYLWGHKSVSTLSKLSIPRADSWPHTPPGSEGLSSAASPSYAADGKEIWLYWRIHRNIKSNHYPFVG